MRSNIKCFDILSCIINDFFVFFFFFSSRRRHTRWNCDWSSDVCSSDLQNTAIYFNDSTLEEVQIKSSGNDAEVSVPGISMVAVMKSGGNTFHGAYQGRSEERRVGKECRSRWWAYH